MAQKNNSNIRKYHKPLNINIGMIIFGVMFIYIIICVIMYMQTEHLSGYEVKTGSLTVNNVYHGIALRSETLYDSVDAGYVYYFAPEGTHVACGDLVYAVDSSGKLAEIINETSTEQKLTNEDYSSLKTKIINYRSNFRETEFSTVYDFKHDLQSEVAKLSNQMVLTAMNEMAGAAGISKYYADRPGTVVFSSDGYESLTPQDITAEHFEEENYTKNLYLSNNRFGKSEPVFKLVSGEDWEIVIQVDSDRVQELQKAEYVKVKFMEDQYETWGKVTVYGSDAEKGITFVGLSFTNSLIDYVTDRFLDVELVLEEDTGLKIPNSAIVQRNFFLIEEDYMMKSGADGATQGVMRQTFTEDNEMTTEFVETPVYNLDEKTGTYYVDEDVLKAGDVLYKEDSTETYTVSKQASLTGVYNINKGYADFKQIQVLYNNDEYSIVESNTQYGLRPYDYIALDASTVTADQFVYK